MYYGRHGVLQIEADVRAPAAVAQLIRFVTDEPCKGEMAHEVCWLDMSLTPRPADARARYFDRWRPNHFERVGDMFFLPGREPLLARGGAGLTTSIALFFQPKTVEDWLGAEVDWTDKRLAACLDLKNDNLRWIMHRVAEETKNPGFGSAVLIETMAVQTAIELARHCKTLDDSAPTTTGGLPPWRLRLIEERLMDLSTAPSLTELAHLCKLSSRQLARAFRTSRGCSIGDYVGRKRIETAKRMLASDRTIKTIAEDMGFHSPSSFTFAFRKATGETPGQYRLRALNL